MTLNDLSAKWQELRDKSLGRGGMSALVSPLLASDVALDYQRFRAWLEAIARVPTSLVTAGDEASEHLEVLRALIARAQHEGVAIDAPPTLSEQLEQGAQALVDVAHTVKLVVGGALLVGLAYVVANALGRRGSHG